MGSKTWGITYIDGECSITRFKRNYRIKITQITSNRLSIDDWVLRFYWKDKSGNIYLNRRKGCELCIEMNPHKKFDGYDSSVYCTIADEISNYNSEFKQVSLWLKKRVQKNLEERMR